MKRLSKGMILWLTISAVGLFGLWTDDHFGILLKIIITGFIVCSCIWLALLDTAEGWDDCMSDEDYGDYVQDEQINDIADYLPEGKLNVVETQDIAWGDMRH